MALRFWLNEFGLSSRFPNWKKCLGVVLFLVIHYNYLASEGREVVRSVLPKLLRPSRCFLAFFLWLATGAIIRVAVLRPAALAMSALVLGPSVLFELQYRGRILNRVLLVWAPVKERSGNLLVTNACTRQTLLSCCLLTQPARQTGFAGRICK